MEAEQEDSYSGWLGGLKSALHQLVADWGIGVGVDKAQAIKSLLAEEMLLTYDYPVDDLVLTLPGEALANARIPPAELERELRRRLSAALFSDGIVGGAAACRLAGMDKAEFQHWLGERGISQPLGVSDYGQEHQNLTAWLEED